MAEKHREYEKKTAKLATTTGIPLDTFNCLPHKEFQSFEMFNWQTDFLMALIYIENYTDFLLFSLMEIMMLWRARAIGTSETHLSPFSFLFFFVVALQVIIIEAWRLSEVRIISVNEVQKYRSKLCVCILIEGFCQKITLIIDFATTIYSDEALVIRILIRFVLKLSLSINCANC